MLIWGMNKISGNRLPHLVTEITWSKVIAVKAEIQIKWQKNPYSYCDFKTIVWCLETETLKSCNWNCPLYKNNVWKQQMQCSTILYHVFLTMCTPVSLMDRNSWSQIKVVQPKEKNLRIFRQQKNFSEIRSHIDKEWVGDHHTKRQKMTFLVSENSQWGRLGIKNCKITSRNRRKHGKKVGEGSREKVLFNRQKKVQSTFYNKIIKSRLTSLLRLKDLFSKLLSLDVNWRKPREVPFKDHQRWSLRG